MSNSFFSTAIQAGEGIRTPWNNIVFPGNYVANLNAYRNQGVQAIPGVNYFRVVGVRMISATTPAGNGSLSILSPDMRQDDKPRLDRTMIIPDTAVVYRAAINTYNLSAETPGGAISFLSSGNSILLGSYPTLTATGASFSDGGATSAYDPARALVDGTMTTDGTVELEWNTQLNIVNPNDVACIISEVCFYMNAPAPDRDELQLPYLTETGQSTN